MVTFYPSEQNHSFVGDKAMPATRRSQLEPASVACCVQPMPTANSVQTLMDQSQQRRDTYPLKDFTSLSSASVYQHSGKARRNTQDP